MTNQNKIQSHNTRLEALEDRINALPDAGTSEDLTAVLDAQQQLISELRTELEGKAAGGDGDSEICTAYLYEPGTTYNPSWVVFKTGDTWNDFANSKFNKYPSNIDNASFYTMVNISGSRVAYAGMSDYYVATADNYNSTVKPTDTIINDFKYLCYYND